MPQRPIEVPPERLFPIDEWRILEAGYTERYAHRAEAAFSLSNGYVGIRGTFDEGRPAITPGTYINGFHETWPIVHTEDAYGLARSGQTIVNVPDATILRLYVDDEPLYVPTARLRRYSRVLDMRDGTLVRELEWSTAAGRHVNVRSCRIVSFEHRHVAAISLEVTVHDGAAPVVISSEIVNRQDASFGANDDAAPSIADPRRAARFQGRVLEPVLAEADGARLSLGYRARRSRMTLGLAADLVVESEAPHQIRSSAEPDRGEVLVTVDARPGVPIRLTKFIAYQTSRAVPPHELVERCERTLDRVARDGFDALLAAQRSHLDRYWDRADVRLGRRHVGGTDAAGRALEPVPARAGDLARRGLRHPGEGPDGVLLRGPLLLGHRDLPAPLPRLHVAADRAEPAALPPLDAASCARARA